jgi:AcrR family transcriptional regulator
MGRAVLHPTGTLLDAARSLVLEQGASAATVAAIAAATGAPTGSIYHRFRSIDELLTAMWIRAVRRSQAEFAAAAAADDPLEAAVGAALSVYDFCVEHPADGRLEDLIRGPLPEAQLAELAELNDPVGRVVSDLARRLYGRASRSAVDRVLLAVFDLPHGVVRRPLIAGERLPPGRRAALAAAVRAALTAG